MIGSLLRLAVAATVTGLLCWASWWMWNEVPRFIRRSEISDFSYFAGLLLIFLCLSLIHPLLSWAWKKLFPPSP